MNTDQPIRPTAMTKADAATMGGFLGFIAGAVVGSGVPHIMGAPQDLAAIFGAGAVMGVVCAVWGYVAK